VFEIGSSLREERLSRGLELTHVEADTRIRIRYLRALEDERFDVLPGTAYVRGFLRTYATYLGLDEQRFIAAYNVRHAPLEELPITPLRRIERRRLRLHPGVGLALAAVLVAVLAWKFGGSGGEQSRATLGRPPIQNVPQTRPTPLKMASRRAQTAKLVLTASRGPCWLLADLGSGAGQQLYMGTLEQGRSLHLAGRRLWIRFGAPENLDASVNARRVALPDDTANVVVTAQAVRTVG
jgi:hypothetical protein